MWRTLGEFIVPPVIGLGLLILGDTEGVVPDAMPGWATQASGFGILTWYLWYNTTKTIPSLTQTFRDEIAIERTRREKEREENRQSLHELRDTVQGAYGRGYVDGMKRQKADEK